jgi:hypothetical protein
VALSAPDLKIRRLPRHAEQRRAVIRCRFRSDRRGLRVLPSPKRSWTVTTSGTARRIAILGWGSLLWDRDEAGREFDEHHGPWWCTGPTLPLEFSHASQKRGGALTLVIDPRGTPTTVAWCVSGRSTMQEAVSDLARREATRTARISQIDDVASRCSDPVAATVAAWAKTKRRLHSVIWTGLEGEFERDARPFPVEAALRYLRGLREGKAGAAEYFRRAPSFVQTPLRRAVEREPWFQELAQAAVGETTGDCRLRRIAATRTVGQP